MDKISGFLNYTIQFTDKVMISVKGILILIFVLIVNYTLLKFLKNVLLKRFDEDNKLKFNTVFSYIKYVLLIVIFLVTLSNIGVNVSAILAGATALLLGVGLALQTFFQDIISGIMMLLDQTIRVNDIIEFEDKIVKVKLISLRTTITETVDGKTLIIPNHKYLTSSVYNWTQKSKIVTDAVCVGVEYGVDTELVKEVLLGVAKNNTQITNTIPSRVVFECFGDSSLNFKLVFSTLVSLEMQFLKSDLNFAIDKAFREHQISIPFPQRDIHIITK